jgi:two-component system sensor kinase FixL
MAGEVRATNWADTPLGPIELWPATLMAAAELVLDSPSPRLMVWGPEFTTIYNDAYVTALGIHPNDGTGKRFERFRPKAWLEIAKPMHAAMAGQGQIVTQLRTTLRGDKSEEAAFFRLSFTPVRDQNGIVRGVMQDLVETTSYLEIQHELTCENRRFRELFDHAPILLVLMVGPNFRIEYANRAYQDTVGGGDVVGLTVTEALGELEIQGFIELLTEVYQTGEPVICRDKTFLLETGREEPKQCYYDFIYQPIVSAEGVVTGILFAGSDVTEHHLEKEQAERLRLELDHASRMSAMGMMAATLAHELNQPLAAAGNYLAGGRTLLASMDEPMKSSVNNAIEKAEQQIHRAADVMRRARALVEQALPTPEIVPVTDLVARAIVLAGASKVCPHVSIQTRLDPNAASVRVDPVQAEQVLLNLIRNACQAMRGSALRELLISSRGIGNGFVEILVRDSGRGLPGGDVTAPFTAFAKSTTGGMGLGVSLSRTLVETHGGRMWAENNTDGGTTFGFTLPLAATNAAAS